MSRVLAMRTPILGAIGLLVALTLAGCGDKDRAYEEDGPCSGCNHLLYDRVGESVVCTESKERFEELQACACEGPCDAYCGNTEICGGGDPYDDWCMACIQHAEDGFPGDCVDEYSECSRDKGLSDPYAENHDDGKGGKGG